MRRFALGFVLVTGCLQEIRPTPKLPPTPMRIAFAKVDAQWYSNKIPPLYLADLVAWFDDWHGLTVVASAAVDALPARSTEIIPITFDTAPIRALCAAARAEGVDAIVFTRFMHLMGPRTVCTKVTGRFSTRYDPGEGGCARTKTSGTRWAADLWFRVLYPAGCVFGYELEIGGNRDLPTWESHREAARLELADLLHGMEGEFEVGERLHVCAPDNAACAAPTHAR